MVGSEKQVPVNILRDSGALDSFILESVFSSASDAVSCVRVRGMGLNVWTVPLHNLCLSSTLVQGEVLLGVCPELPVAGIHVILGNDLAGAHVWGCSLPTPGVVAKDDVGEVCSGKYAESAVYPACVVTQAQSHVISGSETGGKDELRNSSVCFHYLTFRCLLLAVS